MRTSSLRDINNNNICLYEELKKIIPWLYPNSSYLDLCRDNYILEIPGKLVKSNFLTGMELLCVAIFSHFWIWYAHIFISLFWQMWSFLYVNIVWVGGSLLYIHYNYVTDLHGLCVSVSQNSLHLHTQRTDEWIYFKCSWVRKMIELCQVDNDKNNLRIISHTFS